MATDFRNKIPGFETLLVRSGNIVVSDDPYCQQYYEHLYRHRSYFLSVYSHLLGKLAQKCAGPYEEMTLLDIGAGNGLLAVFASYCGFRRVYINDIDKRFLNASRNLAVSLNVQIAGFISGDALTLTSYFSQNKPGIVAGTDVIEHIYDPLGLLRILKSINPDMVIGFTTASNPSNILKVYKLRKLQQRDEQYGSKFVNEGELQGSEPHEAYLDMRKKIISEQFTLAPHHLTVVAKATRGLAGQDIIDAAQMYVDTGTLPVPAEHTNTCHPLTGSWTERILPLRTYKNLFAKAGFALEFHNGFYDDRSPGIKKSFNKIMNGIILILGKFFAPYIILVGFNTKDGSRNTKSFSGKDNNYPHPK